jgi:hypothetical protein
MRAPRRSRRSRLLAVAVLLAVVGVMLPLPANAGVIFPPGETWFGRVAGTIDVINDKTTWSLVVEKTGSGNCVYARIVVDRNNWPDDDFKSNRLCRVGDRQVPWAGESDRLRFTRGAKVQICRDIRFRPDDCQQVWYEPEIVF